MVLDTPDEKLRAVGLSFAKIASIKDLARKTLDGVVPPSEILHTLGDDEIIERITQVRGIGRWTVEMMLMSRLGRRDVLPIDDFGVRNGFRLAYGSARHADDARARGIRRALGALSIGGGVVSVARGGSAPRRQTAGTHDENPHPDREEKSREEEASEAGREEETRGEPPRAPKRRQ